MNNVLIGAPNFMKNFKDKALSATESLYVQAMTFEGDAAGSQLIEIMLNSPAKDKRLLVDCYSKAVINDSFIFSPKYLLDKEFRKEVKNTKRILIRAQAEGIKVKFTNPLGLLLRYPLRNHKKMVVIDEKVSYLGGINFSDHNFEWHDMMIALQDDQIGTCLADDFRKTFEGVNQSISNPINDSTLYFFNGIKSKNLYNQLFDRIVSAKKSVEVISPYVSNPLLRILKKASENGVEVSIISPEKNNKGIFKDILLSELKEEYFKMFEYPGMSHLKAILIDGKTLLFGSSNYDIVSYYWEQEVVLQSNDHSLIEQFNHQVLAPAKEEATLIRSEKASLNFSSSILAILEVFCKITSRTVLRPH